MIRAYSLSNDVAKKGVLLYQEMLHSGNSPNALTSMFATKCCIKFGSLFSGLQIHARILKDGHQSDSLLLTTLMNFYSSMEKGREAHKVFDEISLRDTVAWNVFISCYMRNGRTRDALGLFDAMRNSNGCQPDEVTRLLVLQACAGLNALEFGEQATSKKVITREEWEERLNDVKVRKEDMNKLVMNFLVTESYVEAAEKFRLESDTEPDIDLATITDCMAVKKAVQCGNMEDAIEKVNDLNPEVQ